MKMLSIFPCLCEYVHINIVAVKYTKHIFPPIQAFSRMLMENMYRIVNGVCMLNTGIFQLLARYRRHISNTGVLELVVSVCRKTEVALFNIMKTISYTNIHAYILQIVRLFSHFIHRLHMTMVETTHSIECKRERGIRYRNQMKDPQCIHSRVGRLVNGIE